MSNRLYVLVRGDLTKSQQAVQAGHAIADFCLGKFLPHKSRREGEVPWSNHTLILLSVKDITELLLWRERIYCMGWPVTEFKEPDMNYETTAIAACGINLPEVLSNLPLL